jgi:hypothetical protein
MAQGGGGSRRDGWSAMRPVLVGFLLAADVFAVASLAIVHPGGWFPPFLAFGTLLIGLLWLGVWAIGHRRDDG